ncbi:hypothetical protein HPB52_023790 [Rhipicephalus sanguineus]|uniref:Reverse transcriptase n=1 Tax=Rhipicephalus sanguineus TaxID=34632 RepID=A0A9D4Q3X7_RHISA|nr:hypothetical protein HPB52_023790 [Rhipicephalus sanguineus]
MWGPIDPDERGLQVAQFALANDLITLNDDQSLPTFETLYAASWIDLTFATPSVIASGFRWSVRDDTTFSEHRVVEVTVGDPPASGKRLTSYALCQLLDTLRREVWFSRVSGAAFASPEALDRILMAFQALYDKIYRRHLRPVRTRPTSKPWFTPDLSIERSAVAAKRRRFQRTRDVQMRAVYRREYTSTLAVYRIHIREARDVHMPLIGSDGTLTSTHLESAALLLRTQIAADDHTTDEEIHMHTRSLASAPYATVSQDIPFTYSEVVDVLRNTPNKSAAGPDNITPDSLRILGVIFDRRLAFYHHADFLKSKVATLAARLATFFSMQRACVRPAQKSGLVGRKSCRLPPSGPNPHDSENRPLAHTRAYKTTSTAALQVLMHAPPIDLELERINAEFRLFTLRKHVAFGSLRFRPDWVAHPHGTLLIHPSMPAAVPFARLTREQARVASRTHAIHVYTDGSYTTISAGAAFVVFGWPDKVLATGRFKLHRATSAYSAEVVAFREALQHLLAARYTAPVAIYTDCLSLLQALASPRNAEPHIMEIRSLIRHLSRHVRAYVYHVPGHSGVFGNEVADYMAERASRAGLQRSLPLPFRAVRSQLRRELHVLWAIRWREEYKHTELFRWTIDTCALPSYFPPPPALATLLTGHGRVSVRPRAPKGHSGEALGSLVVLAAQALRRFILSSEASRLREPASALLLPGRRHGKLATAKTVGQVELLRDFSSPSPPKALRRWLQFLNDPGPSGTRICRRHSRLFAVFGNQLASLGLAHGGCEPAPLQPWQVAGNSTQALPLDQSPAVPSTSDTPQSQFSEDGDSFLAGIAETEPQGAPSTSSARPVPSTGQSAEGRHIPATDGARDAGQDEDAQSSVSDATAVLAGLRTDPGTGAQARARELEDEIARFCADTTNRITVSARIYILTGVFELVGLCSDLRADAASERGAATALQGQLVEARREIAGLQRRVIVAERLVVGDLLAGVSAARPHYYAGLATPGGPLAAGPGGGFPTAPGTPGGLSYAAALCSGERPGAPAAAPPGFLGPGNVAGPSAPSRQDHVAFLTPVVATDAPARDVVRLLKTNIDPVAKEIRDVTLHYTRCGVTVFSTNRQSLIYMKHAIEEHTVTRAALTVRVPDRRNPHVSFSGVDTEIGADEFVSLLNDRNPNIQLDPVTSKVCVSLSERGGTKAFIVEVDPPAFHRIMANPRLSIGWTVVRASEDVHVSTCTFCATYGHGRSTCPVSGDVTKAVCMRCGVKGHLASGHPAGHPECPILTDKVAELRVRTNYGGGAGVWGKSVRIAFLQVNLDDTRVSLGNLCDRMGELDISIAVACDPYRPGGRMPKLPQAFSIIAHEEEPAAILLLRRPRFDICPVWTSRFVVAAYCEARDFHFTIISVYAPPHKPLEPTLREVEAVVGRSRSPSVVVAGDLNAKHRAWGPSAGYDRVAQVMQLAAATGLVVLNVPESHPTYETQYASSWIDVTLATAATLFGGNIEVRIGAVRQEHRKRLTRYAQAELLQAIATDPWFDAVTRSHVRSPEALEYTLGSFCDIFDRHRKRHLRPVKARGAGNTWWTPALAAERRRVNALGRRFQRCRDHDFRTLFRIHYSAALAAFRHRISEAKRAYEQECHAACSRGNVFSASFREAFGKVQTARCLPPLERPDGCPTSPYSNRDRRSQYGHTRTRHNKAPGRRHDHNVDDIPFTEAEAPGPDGITPLLMKGLFAVQTRFIMFVLNAALRLGYFPKCWRRGRIIFIPKAGRPPHRTTSYRPICVKSIFGKTLERLLNVRLYHFLWANGHTHANKFGFTHARSAITARVQLKTRLLQLKASKLPAVLMALDFEGAFDSVWHPLVLKFFRDRLVPRNIYHLLLTFLKNRSVVFRSHAGEASADDTVIVIPAISRERLGELASEVLRSVITWTERAKVKLSTEKTFCVLFSHGHGGMERVRPTIRVSRDSRSIAYKDSLRILGVVFDRRLSFFPHADHLKGKAELLCAKVATLARMQGGQLRPAQKLALYRQVLLPALTYGSPVWWDELRPDCRLQTRVLSIQRTILLQLLGAFRTTRTAALQILMHAPPITLILERCNAEYRLLVDRKPIRFGTVMLHPDHVVGSPDPWLDHPATRLAFPFVRLDRTAAKRMAQQHALHIYTDGSYSPRLAGAAFVTFRPKERIGPIGRFRVENATSVYCTELLALQEALLHIRNTCGPNDTLCVYTDCLSLLQALSTPRTSRTRVYSIKRILRDLSPRTAVRLYHVPGHTGVLGNEIADFLVARTAQRGVPKRALLTSRGVRNILRNGERERWENLWKEENADTALFRWVPHASDIPGWFPPNKHLVQFLTGHGRFHFYFRRFRLLPSETCACGLTCEGLERYLYECSLTATLVDTITPRTAYVDKNYPVLLRHARKRAIIIRLVHAVSAVIPDLPALRMLDDTRWILVLPLPFFFRVPFHSRPIRSPPRTSRTSVGSSPHIILTCRALLCTHITTVKSSRWTPRLHLDMVNASSLCVDTSASCTLDFGSLCDSPATLWTTEHKYISTQIGDTRNDKRKRLTRFAQSELLGVLAKEQWFSRVTQAQPASSEALDHVLEGFYRVFNRHLKGHLRPVKDSAGGRSWWTPDLAWQRKGVNAKRRRFQRCPDPVVHCCCESEAKRAYEAECHSACSRANVFSQSYREAFGKTRPPRLLPPQEREDGTLTSTHLESAALLLRTQIAVDSSATDLPSHTVIRRLANAPYDSSAQDVPFTEQEVADVIAHMPPRSSPGPDSGTPLLMRGLFRVQPRFVMLVLNAALRLGYFPRCWRTGRIIFIPKPGRPPQRTTSYRPICVNSVFGKTLERLLNGRIYYFPWKNGYIHDNQFGFTHARSAVVALAKLKARLLQLKASKLPAIVMALDFQGAFDSVWHPLVLKFFRDRKISANLYHLLRTFLFDRTVVFTSHAGQLTAHPSLGSPQGSPLSPMLWNVIIYDLLCLPLTSGITAQAYADDTILIIPAKSRERLGQVASDVLRAVLRWTESAKVTLSKEKTYCVLFSHGQGGMQRVRPTVRLSPSERSLTYKDSLRILGVIFDRRLSFFMHAEYLREKAETLTAKLDTLARMQGGQLHPAQKLRLYRSAILPAITYASPIWWDELRPDCRLRSRLVSLQRMVLNLLGAFRTTRTTALQVLMRAAPITLELERCNAEFHLLIERRPIRHGDLSVHPDSVLYAPDPWGEHPAERLAYCFTRLSRQDAKTLATTYRTHVYTDGSYSPRSAGAAFVVLRSNERIGAVGRYQVQDATSAYCAEIMALTEALIHVKAHERNTTVRIYTDCLSALQAIADYRTYDPRILTIKTLVRDVSQLGIPRRSLLTPYNVRSALRRQELHRWADEWRTQDSDTALFRWVPNALDIPFWFPPNKALVTFLTGHGRFHFYFCRFRLLPNNLCACGVACEDVDHYLYDCRITAHLAERVRPRLDYLDRRYPVLLRYPANRALFIYIVRAVSDVIPDLTT